jgi:hypothetical protein
MFLSSSFDTASQRSGCSTSSCGSTPAAASAVAHLSKEYFDRLEKCNLDCVDVVQKLSSAQYQALLDLRNHRDQVVTQARQSAQANINSGGQEECAAVVRNAPSVVQPQKINVREKARVPFR